MALMVFSGIGMMTTSHRRLSQSDTVEDDQSCYWAHWENMEMEVVQERQKAAC